MRERGLTQSGLARIAGVSRGAVGNILRGVRQPGPELLGAIASGLELPRETVFRAAGLLPERGEPNPERAELCHLFDQLPDRYRADLIAVARALLERARETDQTDRQIAEALGRGQTRLAPRATGEGLEQQPAAYRLG